MDYGSMKLGEASTMASDEPLSGPGSASGRRRYNLTTALLIVRRMETSVTRGAVFDEIKGKNLIYRMVDAVYSRAGAGIVQPLALFAYMVKSVLSVGPFDELGAEAVSLSNFDNERRAIDRVVAMTTNLHLMRLSLKRSHAPGRGQAKALWRQIGALKRLWPFLSTLARTHSFMPAARIASALAFYMRFADLFAERPSLKSAIVASNYSPEAVGMAAAAHRAGRRVIYANHAPVPANGPLVPPVLADCAVLYGDSSRRIYERRSCCLAEVALIGQPWAVRPMGWRDNVRTVGIFLTALTRPDEVARLVASIRSSCPDMRVIIRNHPVALLKNDLSAVIPACAKVEITIGNSLDDEIEACDLIVCGNSGVALNALSGGRPVAYVSSLDGLAYDYNGFVESGLICPAAGWRADLYEALRRFYQRPEWSEVMRSYDASYGVDVNALRDRSAATIMRYLN